MNHQAVTTQGNGGGGREVTPYERFRSYVSTTEFVNGVAALVGGESQARTFVRVVLTAVQQNPPLLASDRRTLLLACMKAARDRLMPDGREAVLNIYGTTVQYLPMVAGLIKKLYDSGLVLSVDAACINEKDEFIFERGDAPRLVHKPFTGDDPGPIVAAYVVIKLANGEVKREVMFKRDIERVRASSKAPDGPGWRTWYDQFAIKSVIKRAYKQLPSSMELQQVIDADNDAVGFADIAGEEVQPPAVTAINAKIAPPQVAPPTVVDIPQDEPAPPPPAPPAPPAPPVFTYAKVAEMIAGATTPDELALARDLIRCVESAKQRRELEQLAVETLARLHPADDLPL